MNTSCTKYPRTPHLPWSGSMTSDDIRNTSCEHFAGKEVIVTEKLDGENTSLYSDTLHARSIDGRHHPSRDWVKAWHATIKADIPEGWRLCGENMYAQHSIIYDQLESYFYLFSVWNEKNQCLSWNETKEWAAMLSCPTPKEIYQGLWDEDAIKEIEIDTETCEGYVVRSIDTIPYDSFAENFGKWVRPKHVQTDEHWMHKPVVPNTLK